MPLTWTLKADGTGKNIKWSQPLGSKAYGGPIISGGKIFVGTNNNTPREPEITGDKGILMCFKESTGEFLWQSSATSWRPAASTTGRKRASAPAPSSRATACGSSPTAARCSA